MEHALEAANAKSLFVVTNLNNWTSPLNALPGLFGGLLFIVYLYVRAYSIFLFFSCCRQFFLFYRTSCATLEELLYH